MRDLWKHSLCGKSLQPKPEVIGTSISQSSQCCLILFLHINSSSSSLQCCSILFLYVNSSSLVGTTSECENYKYKGLNMDDCKKANNNISIQEWKRIQGKITKDSKFVSMEDPIKLFNKHLVILKHHIHLKRFQNGEFNRIKHNLHSNELLIQVDYAKRCESVEQNEIQSV